MFGMGAIPFAVMGYVIAKQVPDRKVGSQVTLNAALLAAIFGESEKDVEKAIDKLCAPDPKSTSPAAGGRRLIKIGQFAYQVVNGAKYRAIRDDDMRRESNRDAQQRHRAKKKESPKDSKPVGGTIENETPEQREARENDVTKGYPRPKAPFVPPPPLEDGDGEKF